MATLKERFVHVGGGRIAVTIIIAFSVVLSAVASFERGEHPPRSELLASDNLLRAAADLAQERGLTLIALNQKRSLFSSTKLAIDRKKLRAHNRIYHALTRSNLPEGHPQVVEVKAKLKAVQQLRNKVYAALRRHREERSSELPLQWFAETTQLIVSVNELRLAVIDPLRGAFPNVDNIFNIQDWAWVLSEYAGRERAVIVSAVAAKKPLSTEQIKTIRDSINKIQHATEVIQKLAASSLLPGKSVVHYRSMQQKFLERYATIRDSVYRMALSGKQQQITASAWFGHLSRAIDSVVQFGSTADQTADYFRVAAKGKI